MTKLPENFKFKVRDDWNGTIYIAVIEGGDPAMVKITWVLEDGTLLEPVSRYFLYNVQGYIETGDWVIVD